MSTEISYNASTDSWTVESDSRPGTFYEVEPATDRRTGRPTGGQYCHEKGDRKRPCKSWQFCRGHAAEKSCKHIDQVMAVASRTRRLAA
jgi:hypothetical protein